VNFKSVLSGKVQVLRKSLAYDAHSHSFLVHKYLHRSNVGYEIEQLYMWQSQVEIEHYSVAYFARITSFEALKRGASVKGGAHTRWVNSSILATFTQRI